MANDNRPDPFKQWNRLKPVYFQTWVWQEICRKYPDKYKMNLPVYKGQKVLLT